MTGGTTSGLRPCTCRLWRVAVLGFVDIMMCEVRLCHSVGAGNTVSTCAPRALSAPGRCPQAVSASRVSAVGCFLRGHASNVEVMGGSDVDLQVGGPRWERRGRAFKQRAGRAEGPRRMGSGGGGRARGLGARK